MGSVKKLNATEELNTTYRLCGKTSRIFTLKKKNEVNRRLRATQPDGAGRDGMWHLNPRASLSRALPSGARGGTAENHVRALATETQHNDTPVSERDATILFLIYYICLFLLFFRISIFYFLVDALRNSPVVLDPLRSVHRSHDRQFLRYFLLQIRIHVSKGRLNKPYTYKTLFL